MAMMMAGRVLLVCALCVLWCGAGGVYARDGENNALGGCMASEVLGACFFHMSSGCNKTAITVPLRSTLPITAVEASAEGETPVAGLNDSGSSEDSIAVVPVTVGVAGAPAGAAASPSGPSGGSDGKNEPSGPLSLDVDSSAGSSNGEAGSRGSTSSNAVGEPPRENPSPDVAAAAHNPPPPGGVAGTTPGNKVEKEEEKEKEKEKELDEEHKRNHGQENQSRLANQSEGEIGREGERLHKKTKVPKEEKEQIQVVEHSIENQGTLHEPGKEPQEIKRENEQSKHQNEELKGGQEKENPLQAIQQNSDAEEEMNKNRQQGQRPQEVTAPLASSSGSEATRKSQSPVPPEALHKKELTDGLREQLEEETPLAATQSKSHGTTDPQSSPASAIAGEAAVTHDADEENATGRNDDEPIETVFADDHQQHEHPENIQKEPAKDKNAVITNGTATPGGGDGSTAFSHTTSPLLLLLFFACAAAAAVVAA
ncbi:Mucin-associated surface protein (MASP) [Trypanosoma cruzi]|uniref:Mucin-associated surface protein (MASP), putative n=2 Tax=Trypanosoma cruzi TaxID=5693 RepID=Q4DZB6_TRYCC|nr:mucin-associated surface protein (MASP), putative [Trypanosoma cruzi]EAN97876.1 mucin-associated surface protein (MASP), putative [Trypanosoma cruzi]PWV04036.1 Mucin-associated surface protein (MASP) [Trypanosoma cruzi]|eukprot:XP_819727.1 mucin-associated surface protein (MASP) [Trypanosoma cruzi strain CL Brener]